MFGLKRAMYTRSDCKRERILFVLVLALGFLFLASASTGEILFSRFFADMFNRPRYEIIRLDNGDRMFYAVLGLVLYVLCPWMGRISFKALRYMDIHKVDSVSYKDLERWAKQNKKTH